MMILFPILLAVVFNATVIYLTIVLVREPKDKNEIDRKQGNQEEVSNSMDENETQNFTRGGITHSTTTKQFSE